MSIAGTFSYVLWYRYTNLILMRLIGPLYPLELEKKFVPGICYTYIYIRTIELIKSSLSLNFYILLTDLHRVAPVGELGIYCLSVNWLDTIEIFFWIIHSRMMSDRLQISSMYIFYIIYSIDVGPIQIWHKMDIVFFPFLCRECNVYPFSLENFWGVKKYVIMLW